MIRNTLLHLDNLHIAFAREGQTPEPVVQGVNLSLGAGEVLGLVGESGSGKSVTAQAILRLLPEPQVQYPEGVIRFDGQSLLTASAGELQHIRGQGISMIFQEPMTSLNPLHRIGRQLAEALYLHDGTRRHRARERIIEWLQRVGFADAEHRLEAFPHELSGGERQRVMIAMALINEPELLIADEPTTALDVTIQQQIIELLLKLQQELGMAVLFITHDLPLVQRLADRVAIMQAGRIVESGPVDAVFRQPQTAYTRRLLAALPDGRPSALADKAPVVLQADRLGVSYGLKKGLLKRTRAHVHAVRDLDLTLRQGETLGVVGESGSGKSTLARALLQLTAYRGEVSLQLPGASAQTLGRLSRPRMQSLRQQLQLIFQDPFGSLSPRMSVSQIVAEGLRVHTQLPAQAVDARVIAALESVHLDPLVRHRYPHEFSGGQRQRIALARALILNPAVLVLDEPTSALDLSVQKDIITLLRELQRERGLSYLFISHDLAVVRAMSHRVIVMKQGQVVETGPTERIFTAPQQAYTRTLVDAIL